MCSREVSGSQEKHRIQQIELAENLKNIQFQKKKLFSDNYCWKKLPTLVDSKELSDLTEVWHFKPQLRPFRFVGRSPTQPGDGTAFGILLGTSLRLENLMTGLFFVGLLGGNLEFWFDVSVFCVFKETSFNLMVFFLLRSQGRSASCCHEPHGAQLSFVDFVSFWGTKITCRDRALPQLQRIKLQGISGHYPTLSTCEEGEYKCCKFVSWMSWYSSIP